MKDKDLPMWSFFVMFFVLIGLMGLYGYVDGLWYPDRKEYGATRQDILRTDREFVHLFEDGALASEINSKNKELQSYVEELDSIDCSKVGYLFNRRRWSRTSEKQKCEDFKHDYEDVKFIPTK